MVSAVRFVGKGFIVSGDEAGTVKFWDLEPRAVEIDLPQRRLTSVRWLQGERVLIAGKGPYLGVIDPRVGSGMRTTDDPVPPPLAFADVLADGSGVRWVNGELQRIKDGLLSDEKIPGAGYVGVAALNPSLTLVLGAKGEVRELTPAGLGRELARLDEGGFTIAERLDDRRGIFAGAKGVAQVDSSTGEVTTILGAGSRAVTAVGSSLVGTAERFFVADAGGEVREVIRGASSRVLVERDGLGVTALAVSPDGKILAVARQRGAVLELRETTLGAVVGVLEAKPSEVLSLRFSPNGRYLAAAGGDWARGGLSVWDVQRPRRCVAGNANAALDRLSAKDGGGATRVHPDALEALRAWGEDALRQASGDAGM
jgi:WD40 repeat protein